MKAVPIWLLLSAIAFAIVTYAYAYRIVDADWPNTLAFHAYLTNGGVATFLKKTFFNEFIFDRRSFFLTWWYQGIAIHFFGIKEWAFKVELGTMLAFFASSLYLVAKQLTDDFVKALLLVLLVLTCPPMSEIVLTSNNWFFCIPLIFLNLNIALVLHCSRKEREGAAVANWAFLALFVSSVLSSFAGEQFIIASFLILACGAYHNRKSRIRLLQVAGACVAVEFFYLTAQIKRFQGVRPWHTLQELGALCGRYCFLLVRNLTMYYGVNPENGFHLTFNYLALTIFALFAFALYKALVSKALERQVFIFALVGAGTLLLWGPYTGARPVPEGRYLFGISYFLTILFFLQFRNNRLVISSLLIYQALLLVSILQTWSHQAEIDRSIDSKLVPVLAKGTKNYLLCLNNSPGFNPLPTRSHAASNYGADWGVTSRLKWQHGLDIELLRDIGEDGRSGLSYYGERWSDISNGRLTILYINTDPPTPFSPLLKVKRGMPATGICDLKFIDKDHYLSQKEHFLRHKEWYRQVSLCR